MSTLGQMVNRWLTKLSLSFYLRTAARRVQPPFSITPDLRFQQPPNESVLPKKLVDRMKLSVGEGPPVKGDHHFVVHFDANMTPLRNFFNDPRIQEMIRQKVKEAVERAKKPPAMPIPIPELTGYTKHYDVVVDETKVPTVAILNQSAALMGIQDLLKQCQKNKLPKHPEYLAVEAKFLESVAVCIGLAAQQLEKMLQVLEANDLAE